MLDQKTGKNLRIGGAALAMLIALFTLCTRLADHNAQTTPLHSRTELHADGELAALSNSLSQSKNQPLYVSHGRNIFQLVSEPAPVQKTIRTSDVRVTPTPVPPEVVLPSTINLKFYGFVKKSGSAKRIFLQDGESIFTGSEGEIVDRHYKIVRVAETSVEVEDLLTDQRQTLQLQEHS